MDSSREEEMMANISSGPVHSTDRVNNMKISSIDVETRSDYHEIESNYCKWLSCEGWMKNNGLIYKNPVRIPQETHYVSVTTPNRLMLFRETVAVYCENRTEHTNTLCGQNADLFNVKADDTYSFRCALKCSERTWEHHSPASCSSISVP
jgi:hypothetical protein